MKKLFFFLLASVGVSVSAVAQDDFRIASAEKHTVATNSFWQNWFVQTNATWSAFYSQERVLVAPFHKFPGGSYYTSMGASFALGKWFTPGLGLRTKVGAWQHGKEEQGLGGDKFWSANEQVLLNLSNLILGYNEQRLWSLIPYVGAGVNRNMSHSHYSTQLSGGLLNTFRLSRHLAANVDLGWNNFEAGNDGISLKKRAHQFSVEVGLTFNIGSSRWNHASDDEAVSALTEGELDALNAQLADALAENDRLQQLLDEQPKEKPQPTVAPQFRTVREVVAAPVSVFFEVGKATVIARRDLQNVASLAQVAKEQKTRVLVTGYADSRTGTPESNMQLSQRRVDVVVDELVRLGVPRDSIDTKAAGGVDELKPSDYNRRITIELK